MIEKAKLLFVSSRPLSWINTAFPFAAGYLMTGGPIDATLIIGSLFFLIPYNLLMYGVNDVFDYESDLRNPRKGGVEGAVVAKSYHTFLLRWSLLLPIPFVVALLLTGTVLSGSVLFGVLFFVIAYSVKGLRFKEIPLLDSITSSLHFVGPLVFALSLTGFQGNAWPFVIAFFLWGVASQSFGAVQDIIPDRQAGLASIATFLGASATVKFAFLCYSASTLILLPHGTASQIVALASAAYIANISPYLSLSDTASEQARSGWGRFLWINYFVGSIVTMALLYSVLVI